MSVSVRSSLAQPLSLTLRAALLVVIAAFSMGNACVSIRPTEKEDSKAKAAASKNNCAACKRMCEVAGEEQSKVDSCQAKCDKSCAE